MEKTTDRDVIEKLTTAHDLVKSCQKVTDFEIYDFAVSSDNTAIYTTLHGIKQISLSHKKHLVIKSFPHKFAYDLCVSPSEEFLATAGYEIKLWDIESGKVLHTLDGHTHAIQSVLFTPDSTKLLSVSEDNSCRLWDVKTGECLKTFLGHTNWVLDVALCNEIIATCGMDCTVRLWDIHTGELLRTFPNIYGKLAFISDTQLMVGQGDIKCLNLVTGEIDYVLMGRFLNTSCVSYEHGEFCSGGDKSLFIWDLTTRDLKRTVKWNSGGVSQVKITPHTIYVSSGLGFIHEIDR